MGLLSSDARVRGLELALGAVAAVTAVVGLAFTIWPRDSGRPGPTPAPTPPPPTRLAGDIIGISVDNPRVVASTPMTVHAQLEIEGFKGRRCQLYLTLFDNGQKRAVPGLSDVQAVVVTPEADADRAVMPVTFTLPSLEGEFYIQLVLKDDKNVELDRHHSMPITITIPFPNAAESALLRHIPSGSSRDCVRTAPTFPGVTAALRCTPLGGATATWYYQFADRSSLQSAYGGRVSTTRLSGGSCQASPFRGEVSYPIAGETGGRMLCFVGTDNLAWIEWTNDKLLIFGQASGASPSSLLGWWTTAGPT